MTTTIPATDQSMLPQRAEAAAKALAALAPESLQLRRPADSAIEALQANGLTKMSLPVDRGGEHAPMATQLEVMARLAEGDASVSWVASVYNAVGHMICAFGDQALDEYVNSAAPRSAGVFAVTGKATKVDGGYVVSGRWPFASGQHHAGWILVPGIADDGAAGPLVWLVPKDEFTVEDDWYVTGFVATGSNAVSLSETFVPDHRTIAFAEIVEGNYRESTYSSDPYYQQPFVPIMCALSAGTAIGLARKALRMFRERIGRRGITYTTYSDQSEAPITHLQLAEAAVKLDQAEFHAQRLATTVDQHIEANLPWDIETRVRCRIDIATSVKLAREVCETIEHASGANATRAEDPLAAILRDVRTISVHSFLLHSTSAELYGRVLAGMEPGVPFV
jgi:alkylation response protein AidB-like acyl-CoA dehydrogenase